MRKAEYTVAVNSRFLSLFLLAFACPLQFLGQQFPISSGTCRVSPAGIESCNWRSQINGPHSPQSSEALDTAAARDHTVLFTTTYVLSPGAPLKKPMDSYDDVIVALTDGTLLDDAGPSHRAFNVAANQVFLMPRNDRYLLRNVGEKDLTLLIIQLRTDQQITTQNRPVR